MLVLMRFQWWRDAINALYKRDKPPPQQPTIMALAHVLQTHNITRYRLQKILSTREEDILRKQPPASVTALEHSAEGIHSQLLYLQLEAAGIQDASADHAASHIGKGVGLAGLLRGTAQWAQHRRTYLPEDVCSEHGIRPDALLQGDPTQGVRDVVFKIASTAKAHLDVGREAATVPTAARPLFLPALAAGMYLDALEKVDFNVFDTNLIQGGFSPLKYTMAVKWNMLRNTY